MLITCSKLVLTRVLSSQFPELDGFGVMGYKGGITRNVSFFVSGIKLLAFNYRNLYLLRLKWLDKSYEIREDRSNNPSDPRHKEKQAVVCRQDLPKIDWNNVLAFSNFVATYWMTHTFLEPLDLILRWGEKNNFVLVKT